MIGSNQSCTVAGCDQPQFGVRGGGLGVFCHAHRYSQPVQHEPRTCPGCDSPFTPRRADQQHCSKRCRNRLSARRTYQSRPGGPKHRRRLTCEACGDTYLGVWGLYCSDACTNKAWKQRRRATYLEGKRRHRERVAARGAA